MAHHQLGDTRGHTRREPSHAVSYGIRRVLHAAFRGLLLFGLDRSDWLVGGGEGGLYRENDGWNAQVIF